MRSEQSRRQARSWWWAAAAVVALVGWVAALATTPPSALIASAVVFAALSLLFSTGVQTTPADRGRAGTVTADWRRLVDHTAVGTVGAIAALGLLRVSLVATFLVALVLAATAAWAFSWRVPTPGGAPSCAPPSGRSYGGEPLAATPIDATASETVGGPVPEPGPLTPAADLQSMTTTELVLAWRRSYSQLMRVRSSPQLAAMAARRQQLLDELERRDGAGVERWLRSGARAASDPSRFLQRPTGPSATSA